MSFLELTKRGILSGNIKMNLWKGKTASGTGGSQVCAFCL